MEMPTLCTGPAPAHTAGPRSSMLWVPTDLAVVLDSAHTAT